MTITPDTINGIVTLIGSLIFLGGMLVAVYKFYDHNKEQTEAINKMREEQTLICYGVLSCLKGLEEQGCNGPVSEALIKLNKHLNLAAHEKL